MVECILCGKTGIKIRNAVAVFVKGRNGFACKTCAGKKIGGNEPEMYFKKP